MANPTVGLPFSPYRLRERPQDIDRIDPAAIRLCHDGHRKITRTPEGRRRKPVGISHCGTIYVLAATSESAT
jgi:hypothetical protein